MNIWQIWKLSQRELQLTVFFITVRQLLHIYGFTVLVQSITCKIILNDSHQPFSVRRFRFQVLQLLLRITFNDHKRATVNNFILHLFLLVARIFGILCSLQGVEHDFFLAARAISLGRCIFVLEATVPIQRHFRSLLLNDDLVFAEFNRLLLLLLILS